MGYNQFPNPATSIPVDPSAGRSLIVGANLGTFGYSTIQEAVDAAGEGDTIYVQPGEYDENVLVETDYLTIVGGQVGRYGYPDVTATAGVPLTVRAQGFVCKRVRFASGDGSDCVVQEGNGFVYDDCVFDDASDVGQAGVRLKGNATDDSMTASEGIIKACLVRGNAVGICFDTAEAAVGVGSTHNVIEDCRFIGNLVDLATQDTGPGTYSVQTTLIKNCSFLDKNKAVYVDFTTTNGGAAGDQSGMIQGCYFATDAITTTNIALVGTAFVVIGCFDTVGIQDGSGLD